MFGLIVALVVLAVLQYRWIDEASRADRERAQIALDTSVAQFMLEFRREVTRPLALMRREPRPPFEGGEMDNPVERFWEALRSTPENGLLKRPYLAEPNLGNPRLRVLDPERGWVAAEWPTQLEPIRRDLVEASAPERPERGDMRGGPPLLGVYQQIPAIVLTMMHFRIQRGPDSGPLPPPAPQVSEVLILELNEQYLRDELLPLLARKHFGGGFYQVAIIRMNGSTRELLYDSNPERGPIPEARADVRAQLFGRLPERFAAGRPFEGEDFPDRPVRTPGFRFRLMPAHQEGNFELLVRHPAGSLDTAISGLRSRNLGISFGVLTLLTAAMVLLVVSTQRARRLAKAQMDFVVSVSHELRTPLTVICSAGDNLADGVVDPNPAVREYGAIVRDQGRSLRGMVEQILSLAASRANRILDLKPVDLGLLVPAILEENGAAVELAGFQVETELEPGLPPVLADEGALKQCIQNLLSNAIKYGAPGNWIGVTARRQGARVLLTVRDRGMGIERSDLAHVFEPFYRGRAAQESQIHGTGVGLNLAREMMEAMGGKVTVKSSQGKGSAFTLHLPAAMEKTP